jgi:hypothetical protein
LRQAAQAARVNHEQFGLCRRATVAGRGRTLSRQVSLRFARNTVYMI